MINPSIAYSFWSNREIKLVWDRKLMCFGVCVGDSRES